MKTQPFYACKNPFVTDKIYIGYVVDTLAMPQFLINFEWHRDSKGYEIVGPDRHRRPKPLHHPILGFEIEESLIGSAPGLRERERVRRCGGELQPYRPLDKFESLFTQFANEAISASGLLQFIKKFSSAHLPGYKHSWGHCSICSRHF